MKKIISLVVFILALVWTWNVVHTNQAIGFETHSGIQERLADLIKNTVAAKKPHAKDLSISRLWTEPMTDNKVRAVFAYKFTDVVEGEGEIEQVIEGEAILHREAADADGTDKWTLQSVKTTNDTVTFVEGTLLTPEAEPTAPATETTPGMSPATPATGTVSPAPAEKTESH